MNNQVPQIKFELAPVTLVTNVELETGALRCSRDKKEKYLVLNKVGLYGQGKVLWKMLSLTTGVVWQTQEGYIKEHYPYTVYQEPKR